MNTDDIVITRASATIEYHAVDISWSGNCGFGKIHLYKNKERANLRIDSEHMSPEMVQPIVAALVKQSFFADFQSYTSEHHTINTEEAVSYLSRNKNVLYLPFDSLSDEKTFTDRWHIDDHRILNVQCKLPEGYDNDDYLGYYINIPSQGFGEGFIQAYITTYTDVVLKGDDMDDQKYNVLSAHARIFEDHFIIKWQIQEIGTGETVVNYDNERGMLRWETNGLGKDVMVAVMEKIVNDALFIDLVDSVKNIEPLDKETVNSLNICGEGNIINAAFYKDLTSHEEVAQYRWEIEHNKVINVWLNKSVEPSITDPGLEYESLVRQKGFGDEFLQAQLWTWEDIPK